MKFYAKFNNNKCLCIYPPNKKGHCLFLIDLNKFKNKDLILLLDMLIPFLEMDFTNYTSLICYLALKKIYI